MEQREWWHNPRGEWFVNVVISNESSMPLYGRPFSSRLISEEAMEDAKLGGLRPHLRLHIRLKPAKE